MENGVKLRIINLVIVEKLTRKCYNERMLHKTPGKIYKYWTNQEIILLKKLYPKIRLKKLARFFPKRNKATIIAKALSLKLISVKLWKEEENRILTKLFFASPAQTIQKLLPKRSWSAILAQGERLGLTRKRDVPRVKVNENYFRK